MLISSDLFTILHVKRKNHITAFYTLRGRRIRVMAYKVFDRRVGIIHTWHVYAV